MILHRHLFDFRLNKGEYEINKKIKLKILNNNTHVLSTDIHTPCTLQIYVRMLHITSLVPLTPSVTEFGNNNKIL